VTGILLPCRRCGRQVFSSEVRDGLCQDCRVDEAAAELRVELVRLWRKRERYQAGRANVDSVSRQIEKVQRRLASRILSIVPEEAAAAEQFERTLKKARDDRLDLRSLR
jgi:NMD protein affecting ribosome stability and mRNA decay